MNVSLIIYESVNVIGPTVYTSYQIDNMTFYYIVIKSSHDSTVKHGLNKRLSKTFNNNNNKNNNINLSCNKQYLMIGSGDKQLTVD